jgi:hypothetical protein
MPTLPGVLATSLTYDDLVQALGAQALELLCLRRLVMTLQADVATLRSTPVTTEPSENELHIPEGASDGTTPDPIGHYPEPAPGWHQ